MRQPGLLAAAALYALDCNLSRLVEDHANARLLVDRLSDCPPVRPSHPESNIVMLDLQRERDTADTVIPRLAQAGVIVVSVHARRRPAGCLHGVSRTDRSLASRTTCPAIRVP